MNIICPHCNFSKTVDSAQVPDRPVKVNCPKCKERFTFDKKVQKQETPGNTVVQQKDSLPSQSGDYKGRRIICNACGTVQPPTARCVQCGATIVATASPINEQSYAGFWVRVLAYLIDSDCHRGRPRHQHHHLAFRSCTQYQLCGLLHRILRPDPWQDGVAHQGYPHRRQPAQLRSSCTTRSPW
jgi:predicted Zn finger-like uncharacterized protein